MPGGSGNAVHCSLLHQLAESFDDEVGESFDDEVAESFDDEVK